MRELHPHARRRGPDVTGVRAYSSINVAWRRLEEFLGDRFDQSLTDYTTCCTFVEDEFFRLGSAFYERSIGYLYELTHFHFSTYKDACFDVITSAVTELELSDIADVGGGIGLDAQALASQGLDLTLYDFQCPSTEYASWRLRQDGHIETRVQAMDKLGTETHGLVYAVDTLEHVPNPDRLISQLFAAGRYVCVNFFEHDPSEWDGRDMHYPLNHWILLPEFGRYGQLMQLAISGATVTTLWKAGR